LVVLQRMVAGARPATEVRRHMVVLLRTVVAVGEAGVCGVALAT
jgi:hypothetical protein